MKALLTICLTFFLSATVMQTAVAQNAMPEIRFPDADQAKRSTAPQAATPQSGARPGSSTRGVHPSPHHPLTARSDLGGSADQLNRAELNYLFGGPGAGRASIR